MQALLFLKTALELNQIFRPHITQHIAQSRIYPEEILSNHITPTWCPFFYMAISMAQSLLKMKLA